MCLIAIGACSSTKRSAVNKEDIRQVIRSSRSKIKGCYNVSRKEDPTKNVSDKVILKWSVINTKVEKTEVLKNTTNSELLTDCMSKVIAGLKFPDMGTKTEAVITFPFVFSESIK